ncbi:insulinase family protein [Massilia forsythiae]|uniref:Insulinase family protein n=1 Tax=Massilia forsythiae TaxID=2728020 RepID=A0A7Z2VT24_9BURK|nr:insulinase family protein [Massilia forsythiae]QJD98670.1 insulinase family protein [Massilia forsythiae]
MPFFSASTIGIAVRLGRAARLYLCLCSYVCAAHAVAVEPPPVSLQPDAPLPTSARVKVGKLDNGLTYYIQRNRKPENRLELRLVVRAGSILEDEDQRGLAHVVEHLAFNGSRHFRKHELVSYLQSIGIKLGADLNAYTGFDETVYVLPVPTERKDDLDRAFLVLQDWAQGLTLDEADIDKERGIVLEELRLGKGAADRMQKVLLPKIYNGSRYAERLPIGQESTLRDFRPDALRRFYRDWYRPDLMAVVAIGDVDPAELESLVRRHFSDLKNPSPARPRPYAAIPVRDGSEAVVVTDREAGPASVLVRYPVTPWRERATVGGYREQLVEILFSGMLGQRLQELSQQPVAPFIGASSGFGRLTPRYRSWNTAAALASGGAAGAIDALVRENERARRFGFSEDELAPIKKSMLRTYENAYRERDKTDSAVYAAEYMRNFLEGESIPGIDAEYRYVTELVPGIGLDEINAYARRAIPAPGAGKLVVYTGPIAGPTASPITSPVAAAAGAAGKPAAAASGVVAGAPAPAPAPPSSEQLLGMVSAAETRAAAAQAPSQATKAMPAALMAAPPAPGRIVAESRDARLGLTHLTLSNGVKVILKPTDFRNDQVLMSAVRFGGQSLFDAPDMFNARYADDIVAAMGLKDFSPTDLRRVLAGTAAGVSVGLGGNTDMVAGNAGAADVETMLQIVWLKFAGVRRDEDLYHAFVGKQMELARNRLAQPGARFGDALLDTLYGGDPRTPRAARPEDIARLDLDRAIAIYRQRFSSARGLTFILVGSFDADTLKPLLATYLGSLPAPPLPAAYRDPGLRPVKGVFKREVKGGSEDKSTVSLTFTGPATFGDAASGHGSGNAMREELRLAALVEVMNLRIIDVLRERLGLIYGGGMEASMTRIPYPHYSVGITLPTGPRNVDRLLQAAFAEIERMRTEGPAQADLDKVKVNWQQNYRKSLQENGYWLGMLQGALVEGTDPALLLDVGQEIGRLRVEDVREAARRYLDMENYVQVVLNPEK